MKSHKKNQSIFNILISIPQILKHQSKIWAASSEPKD